MKTDKIITHFYKSGEPKIKMSCNTKDKKVLCEIWDENRVKRLRYKCVDKKKHGKYLEYHKNGKKKFFLHYESGIRNGICIVWWGNGNRKLICNYKNGKINDKLTRWHENGLLKMNIDNIKDNIIIGNIEHF